MPTAARRPHTPAIAADRDPRWAAVAGRDASADGRFVYAVTTTGVYCRPSCPSRPKPENVRFLAGPAEAEAAGFRPCKRCRADQAPLEARVAGQDWARIGAELDARGWAVLPRLFDSAECRALAGLYAEPDRFRSRVTMARHGFGRGEYQYFAYPLPDPVQALRAALYPRLAPVADRWNAALGVEARFPAAHVDYLARCHAAGQTRATPLLLQYGPGDYNCLHQDLYGEHVFPLQAAVLLSAPGEDFEGGEFVLTEQRPRMQSRASVVPLGQGDAVVFAVHHRPAQGARGSYRVTLRHGVSEVRSGRRHVLGVIFHDAS